MPARGGDRRRTLAHSSRVDAPHRAARLEDWVTRRAVSLLGRRGWVPTVIGYRCYGSSGTGVGQGWVRVLGRVVLSRPPRGDEPVDVTPEEGEALGSAAVKALRGWRSFVTVPVPGQRVRASVDGVGHDLLSDRGGYLDVVLPASLAPGEHHLGLVPAGGDEAGGDEAGGEGAGEEVSVPVTVIGEGGHGIVSDIDDTVMITSLPRPLIAFWNTFVLYPQARRPVAGMAQLLTRAAAQRGGAPVFYLSTGAWNVAPALARFVRRHGFPAGVMLLTDWGPTNTGWFRSGREHKRLALARLAREFPRVRWLLVGDDGQHDPEVYQEFAARSPEHVRAVAIRQLTPAEQVLSHGLPVPVPARPGRAGGAPEVRGPDGSSLLRQLRGAGLL